MKRRWLLTALGAILAGAGLHFLWQALPNPLFALISPVNESVWEHLKLLYWPMLAAALVLARGPRRIAVWAGFFPAIVLQPVVLLALYYGLRALGVQGLAVDLTLYVLTMAGGFLLAARLSRSGPVRRLTGVSLLAVMLYGAALVLLRSRPRRSGSFSPEERAAKNRFGRKWTEAIFECFCAKMIDQAASRTTATPSTRFAITSSP